MDKFRRIIESGYYGYNTPSSREIIRDSSEVSRYIDERRQHFSYIQQLMNDRIIDEAMGRVRSRGDFEYDGDGGFIYKPDRTRFQQNRLINEQYPSQPVRQNVQQYPQQDSVMARLDAMEREMSALREENRQLRSRYGNLR
jgi:hypothetical protein